MTSALAWLWLLIWLTMHFPEGWTPCYGQQQWTLPSVRSIYPHGPRTGCKIDFLNKQKSQFSLCNARSTQTCHAHTHRHQTHTDTPHTLTHHKDTPHRRTTHTPQRQTHQTHTTQTQHTYRHTNTLLPCSVHSQPHAPADELWIWKHRAVDPGAIWLFLATRSVWKICNRCSWLTFSPPLKKLQRQRAPLPEKGILGIKHLILAG